ncbi:hypothetical protein PENDEC_c003G04835 [Penicillium decumbens]|uniref:Glycosyl transferase family 25 domain-containing protein n=1 Tax=Penicillium decumbens TaxID=69771 RepID=A0A1V6PK02_PENDC|nr:hypothetical protein PENDEC_c003G04835 [Penicillium decumbens]
MLQPGGNRMPTIGRWWNSAGTPLHRDDLALSPLPSLPKLAPATQETLQIIFNAVIQASYPRPALSTIQLRWGRLLLVLLGALALIYRFWPAPPNPINITQPQQAWAWDDLVTIKNQTLGFGKVFAINLPDRPDKRDNIVLGSSICNFQVEFVNGVTPEEIQRKTYPYNWNPDHSQGEYGARRAHLNAIRLIVEEGLDNGVIFEDDADWDVNIKSQLQSFALAVRALQGTAETKTSSPYGDDWDILWLGHCFYAVSYVGAQKLLAALSVNPSGLAEEIDTGAQFDVALGRVCGQGYLRCFAPYPAITGGFRSAGASEKGSDIHQEGGGTVGFASWGMLYSTMLNVPRILRGEPVKAT